MYGYSDPCEFIIDGKVFGKFDGRSTPNGKRPKDGKYWDLVYGCIALGTYQAKYCHDSNNRLCFVINEGKEIPAILPNPNHNYRHVVSSVECHKGYREDNPDTSNNEDLPGSAACLTIKPSQWDTLCSYFTIGENVVIEIKGTI
jgi:hypothetical protein